ncbi:MAG: hypothetical protein NUV97_03850 [archaeon]|nr:hypothetical protein [archaeon]MCR4323848.1 hypothetical protein [Nanoarchaeota archaeon]
MKPIEDIFAKTKTKKEQLCPNPKIPIIIDTREKQSLIAANLIEQKANINFEKLEIGDYLIQDTIIERKSFPDFVGSMINKRLQDQLSNLKKYPKHFLIIEGFDYDYKKFNVHENAIRGMLLSIAIDFQVPIIFTEDEGDTAKFLILTARKYEKPIVKFSTRPTKTTKTLEEQKLFILEGFPGIGPTTAYALLKKFGSLKEVFKASKEELKEIERFEENKMNNFKEILDN